MDMTKRKAGTRTLIALGLFCLAICALLGCARPAQAAGLDSANLLQGEYTVQASLMNASTPDRPSVANGALENPIVITVDASHDYTAELSMKPITMMGTTAYMKSLSYWDGAKYQESKVSSAYDDVADGFGSGYPKELSFPLLNKTAGDEDGYVRLQVDVPIIAAMSGGRASSVQNVYMKIDWSTLQQIKERESVSGKVTYALAGKTAMARSISKEAKAATIKPTVNIGGKSYKVTAIAAGAASGAKNMTKLTIGKNVKTIGKQAFKGCKKLKTVVFKGKNVKKVGSQAFKGVAKKATFKMPKSKVKNYGKLVKKAGAPKTAKFKAA